ncbi:hydantoinase B/oxoprolinase family protein [Limobrevibacterium gyesilva]|uniref:Hydantoinase B/oxoprolinase family protein n=1 Tax=Limobrevibacterium gyesilva TaxID=2991712 RepID=A0AA42CIT5_9PROT|nr:hydantoinase B/oxoprolinase family protein [Limobrevibacterium gyesilva]MCW3476225.1 hydantoinase B/oxoprolinase family protein [Limobrevibacterium gyesilva]
MLDPVTLAVLKGRLEQIADEMDATLFRAAFNPTIAEAHDACHGIYDAATGATLIQGKSGLPIFVGVMAFGVRAVIDKFTGDNAPAEGDVFIFNDPYLGGTHLSDLRLVRPCFRDGRLFCWLASVGHWHDVGGAVPGNYNPAATEYFQEGVLIPPVRLITAGRLNQDILDILLAASRMPMSAYGDLNAHLSALDLGAARVAALLDEYGTEMVAAALGELTARAAAQIRAEIAALPDGTWHEEDFLDNDGRTDVPLRIACAVTVSGDRLKLDFTGSADACAGPVNISRATTVASVYVALKHLFPEVAANSGVLDPIDIVLPPNALLDAQRPKPVGGYTETILRIIDVLFCAFARIRPDHAYGNAYGTINALSIAGLRPDGQRWVMFSFFGGGHGGNPEGDGLSHGNPPIATAIIPPVEIMEAAYPIRFTQWALRPGSGGAGTHRGGMGAIYEIELRDSSAEAFVFAERARFAPRGVLGGGSGAPNVVSFEQDDGWHTPPLASKVVGVRLKRGQHIRLESPGGGGWGDPAGRDPAAVARDKRLGYVP